MFNFRTINVLVILFIIKNMLSTAASRPVPPIVTSASGDTFKFLGEMVTFKCSYMTRSPETVTVEWLRDGNLMSESAYGGRISFHDDPKENNSGLKIFQTKVRDQHLLCSLSHQCILLSKQSLLISPVTFNTISNTHFIVTKS